MREGLEQWDFVIAAYALGIIGTAVMLAWAWGSMKYREKRRDEARRK